MLHCSTLRVVAITDNLRDGVPGLVARAQAARRGGVTMIQLRLPDEPARALVAAARALVESLDVPVVVHGRVDIAVATGAAGVHLGVSDVLPADVRRIAGEGLIIGRSAGNEEEARLAGGADYVALGPVFPAAGQCADGTLGLEGFARVARLVSIPVIAIGGISTRTAVDVVRAGASGVALISGILGAPDPELAAKTLHSAIET